MVHEVQYDLSLSVIDQSFVYLLTEDLCSALDT